MDMLGKTIAVGLLSRHILWRLEAPLSTWNSMVDAQGAASTGSVAVHSCTSQRLSGDLCGECASGRFTELSIIITLW